MLILIAEDNLMNQKVLKAILDRNQIAYEIVDNGLKAVELFKIKKYDLVFMDCQMPILDGYMATQLMRKEELGNEDFFEQKRCPIIAITANAMSGDRERCLDSGMDDFLAKPFKSQDILNLIQKWENTFKNNSKNSA